MSQTHTKKERKSTKTGKQDTPKPTEKTSKSFESKLEEEAKKFKEQRKSPRVGMKSMNSRVYIVGQAMNALLILSQGRSSIEEIKREAEQIADQILSDY